MVSRFCLLRCVCWSVLAVCVGAVFSPPSLAQINAAAAQPEIAPPSFGAPAEKLNLPGVPRAGKISDVLFRGAQPSQQKVFVHCHYGEDRSGVMVAAYRIARQNWTADQAVAEMVSFGFHYHLYPGMQSYVRKFPSSFSSESVFAPLRSAKP